MVKVSIIVPAYNVEAFIGECLESLVNQTLKDTEILIVDDGSSDTTPEIVDDYGGRFENVRVVHKENGGQSRARNIGLLMAKGEYVLFVDSDDYVALDACEVLYESAKNVDADIVHGEILNAKESLKKDPKFRWVPAEGHLVSGMDYFRQAVRYNAYDIVPWLNLTRRALLVDNQLLFTEGHYYEDHEYTLRLYTQFPSKVLKLRFPFYYYRLNRPGSTTTACSLKKGMDIAFISNRMSEYVHRSMVEDKTEMYQILSNTLSHLIQVWLRLPSEEDRRTVIGAISKDFMCDAIRCPYPILRNKWTNLLFSWSPYVVYQRYGVTGMCVRLAGALRRLIGIAKKTPDSDGVQR